MVGSDMHLNNEIDSFIKLKLNDKDDLSVDSIFESLKNNTHEAVLIEKNPQKIVFQGFFSEFHELEGFLNYLFNLDSYQYFSWIIWSTGLMAIFAAIYKKLKDLDLERCKYKIC